MTDAIISGLLLGLALVFSVGPVIFTIIKLRINYGVASAFYFIAGVWLSDLLWVFTANVFGDLLGALIVYKKTIGITGGIFLISLGIFYLFFKKYHSKEELDKGIKIASTTHARLFPDACLSKMIGFAKVHIGYKKALVLFPPQTFFRPQGKFCSFNFYYQSFCLQFTTKGRI